MKRDREVRGERAGMWRTRARAELARPARGLLWAAAALVGSGLFPTEARAQPCPCVGPERGAVIAAGGGVLDPSIYERFVELAGGAEARVVLIPTAGTAYGGQDGWRAIEELRTAGVEKLEILHTRSSDVADLEVFAAPLEKATGVWLSGGHQWRLVDVYLNTETHRELRKELERGGVIGGNSAGASALASFLLRGGSYNGEIIATERVDGFGFLHNVAIDQHLQERGRENEMFEVLRREPHLLGIGLNEGAALVVTRNLARVIGGRVAIYDVTDPLTLIPLRWLDPGDAYDLGGRRVILADEGPTPPGIDIEPAATGSRSPGAAPAPPPGAPRQ